MEELEEKQQEEAQNTEMAVRKEYRMLLSPCNIPVDDTSHLAVDDLKFALMQSDSRNIAVTGHYGSGKSSVANTCINEMGIDDEVLRISMSTFALPSDTKPAGGTLYSDDIEYKIVQHLLYKCDKSKIPYSGFKQIHQPKQRDFSSYVIWVLLSFFCFIIAFEPSLFRIDSFYDAYYDLLGDRTGRKVNIIADTLSIVYLIWFLYQAGRIVASKLHLIRSVKVEAKGVNLEASKDAEVSIFNKYLDEIIYIIQSNRYNYILFEDLDRLDNSDRLFLKIRELNMLINESEAFKSQNRVVRFIYAIRDDVFNRELRTKCFDYIVAVVPVVDHYNMTDYLIKEYKKNGLFQTIETAVLEQLLKKVSGLRELKNIVNEYTLFEKSLQSHLNEDADNYEQKLLAVIIYKNLYPLDFAKAYIKQGLFYSVFNHKELFYEGLTKELEEKSQAALQAMNEAREKIVNTRRQYLETMNEGMTVTSLIKDGYDYTLEQVATRDNLFELFENDGFDRYTYREDDNEIVGESEYGFVFEELEKKVTEDLDYYGSVYDVQEKYRKSNEERISIEKKIKVIENTALCELIKEIGTEETKSILTHLYVKEYLAKNGEDQMVNEDMVDTIQSMLYGGYITEDYYLYISKFYEGSTSERDYQFTNAILQGAEKPYGHKLNSAMTVVSKLRVEDFKNRSVLNYDILNYLLESKQEHFLPTFIETVRETPEFIVSYFQMYAPVNDEFFTRVFDGWNSCINIIRGQDRVENSETLLRLFLKVAPLSIKLTDGEKVYLEGKYEFINTNIQFFNVKKLKSFVNHYKLCFESLVKPNTNSQDLYQYCIVNKHFAINKNNLEVVLGDSFSRRPITAILEEKDIRLKNYLLHNEKTIVSLLEPNCNEEDRSAIVHLIYEKEAEDEWIITYLSGQQLVFDTITDLDTRAIDLVLKSDKMMVSWDLILDALSIIGSLTDSLNSYITRHSAELSIQKCNGAPEMIELLHQQLFYGEKQPFDVFKLLIKCFDVEFTLEEIKQLSEERILDVIRQNKVGMSKDIFEYLNKSSTEEVADEYLILHFDEILDDDEIDWKEYRRNSLGINVLNSNLTLEQKKRFLNDYLVMEEHESDSNNLAGLICFYYFLCGVDGDDVDKDLIVKAVSVFQGAGSWETKIKLINKCNESWDYEVDRENYLLKGLGGEYDRLTYPRGWARFDVNEHNSVLLEYLKSKGHYISKVEERDGQYYVTFRHS